jgi:dipeptide transport system substrate-binding protein
VGLRVHSAWRNETYDGLVERARRLTDQAERMRLYQQADRILVEEVPILPLSYERIPLLVKPWVRRFTDWTAWWKDVVIEPH